MTATQADIDDFLAQDHIAFVGVSREPKAFANAVYRHLQQPGRTLYPVNAAADGAALNGDPSYRSLGELPDDVAGVIVMVPPQRSAEVVRAAAQCGIPRVWLHHGIGPGSDTPAAVAAAREAGMRVVDGACPFMFVRPVTGAHRWHRALSHRGHPH